MKYKYSILTYNFGGYEILHEINPLHDEYLKDNRVMKAEEIINKIDF